MSDQAQINIIHGFKGRSHRKTCKTSLGPLQFIYIFVNFFVAFLHSCFLMLSYNMGLLI